MFTSASSRVLSAAAAMFVLSLLSAHAVGFPAGAQPQAPVTTPPSLRATLDRYCIGCHNARLKTAGLVLDTDGANVDDVGANPELWEKVVRKMRSQAMPPPGARRPDKTGYLTFTRSLESALDRAAALHPHPGAPTAHRLNRAEYANAVRDLLGLEVDVRSLLPPDDSGYGFDNVADVLSTSPGLLERYLLAAGKIGRLAVGDPTIRPAVVSYRAAPLFAQDDRTSEDQPFGSRGGLAVRHTFPVDGEYGIKIRLQRTYTEIIRGMTEPHRLQIRLNRELVKEFTVGGPQPRTAGMKPQEADGALEVRLTVKAGEALVGAAFVKEPKVDEGIYQPRPPLASFEYAGKADTEAGIDAVQISGPYNAVRPVESPSRRKVFVCDPADRADELPCARKIVAALARRAYRRPVSPGEVDGLLRFYEDGHRQGAFDEGIEWVIERVLVAPDFLFRIEQDAPGSTDVAHRISDIELASRLSFFLWSSIPDEELLTLAEQGRLKDPAVLEQQVRRLLADERADALVRNFAGQWLYLRNVRGQAPNPDLFPDFDDNLREAFQRETELFFESQLREDHSVIDLLRANYTFVNERLARHYGIPGIYGSHFRRVTFTDDRRAGLLGQGSILMVTSYAHRTSPVKRGQWLLENLLGSPPPPPPPNIPALKENNEGGTPTSVRERLEEHRRDAACATCHSRMDPLGFALENFDAIGRWRTKDEAGKPIDASGTLPDGTRFQGPAEFRAVLLARSDEFVSVVTEKLLTYGLGRGVEYYDMPAVRSIMRAASPGQYRWSAIVTGIVDSVPFRMRTAPTSGAAAERQARLQQ